MYQTPRYFLQNNKGVVSIFDASNQLIENDFITLPEGCHWTILSAEKINFIWTGPEEDVIFPLCETMEVLYVEEVATIDLIGHHFTEEYEIWFDDVPIEVGSLQK